MIPFTIKQGIKRPAAFHCVKHIDGPFINNMRLFQNFSFGTATFKKRSFARL
jgi:hypothetical protein